MDRFSTSDVSDLTGFLEHERYYLAEESPEYIWEAYRNLDPDIVWRKHMARFGAMYVPEEDRIYTSVNDAPLVAEGQLVILDLLIEEFLHVPAAFQVTSFDDGNMTIIFTYLEENKSHGYQEIRLLPFESEDGEFTVLRHKSWFKSDSGFRDTLFYKPYHSQMVDEFHRTVASAKNYKVKVISTKKLARIGAPAFDNSP